MLINKIKPLLDDRKVTPYSFGKDLNIAQGTAYKLYKEPDRIPSAEILGKICDRYRVPVGEVIEWESQKH
jgi:DNA-binding Xre family transcriptional regulator